MAQASETKLKATIFRQQLILYLWLSVFAFIGVFLIFGAVYWKQASRENGDNVRIFQLGQSIPQGEAADNVQKFITERSEQGGLVTDLLRDLGIALVISVFVTIAIELHANRRLREHITYDVLSAAYAKVIPEKIYAQVADNVFRSNVYRRNWEVHISADSQQVDKERGIAIIKVQYSYDLENLNERKLQSYPIYGVIDLDVPLPEQDIPKFTLIEVNDDHNQPVVSKKGAPLLAAQKNPTDPNGNLKITRSTQEIRFIASVPIPGRGIVTVKYNVERAVRIPGDYVLNVPVPADGIKIILNVSGFKMDVLPMHPDREALRHPHRDTWQFDAGILPWQGFRFTAEV